MTTPTRVFNRAWRAAGEAIEDTRTDVERVVADYQAGYEPPAIVERTGIGLRRVQHILGQAGGPALRREFVPLCMSAEELAAWRPTHAQGTFYENGRPITPCHDCPLDFAAEQRVAGTCNGTPRHIAPEPELPARKDRHMTTVKVNVAAPCGDCVHREVCARRESITALQQGDLAAEHSTLRGGLTLILAANVSCDAYVAEKKSHHSLAVDEPVKQRIWTPEQRAAQGERLRAMNAAKRESAEAAG